MSPRPLILAFVGFIIVCGGFLLLVLEGNAPMARGDRASEVRIAELRKSIDARLSRLESRLARHSEAAPTAVSPSEASGATNDAPGANDPDARLARIEARLDELEIRFRASDRDPVLRGHTYLESESAELRRRGVQLLARLARSDPEARQAIRTMLDDPDSNVREEAIEALAEVDDVESVPRILGLLADGDEDVREEAADAIDDILEDHDDPAALASAIDTLIPSLTDPDGRVRETAAETLGDLGAKAAVPQLMKLLADPNEDVRENAIEALGDIRSPEAAPAIRDLYDKSEGREALRLAAVLRRLGDDSAAVTEAARLRNVALTSPNSEAREDAVEFIAENAAESYRDVLERALEDPDEDVREEAEEGLRELEERRRGGRDGER